MTTEKTQSFVPVYIVGFLGDISTSVLAVGTVLLAYFIGASPFQVGLVGSAYGMSYLIAPILMGRLGDRMGRRKALIFSLVIWGFLQIYFILTSSSWVPIFLGNIVAGFLMGTFWPNLSAHTSNASGNKHDRVMATLCVSWSLGLTIGPFITGIFGEISPFIAFWFLGALTCVLLFIILRCPIFQEVEQAIENRQVSGGSMDNLGNSIHSQQENATGMFLPLVVLTAATFVFGFNSSLFTSLFPVYALEPGNGLGTTSFLMGSALLMIGIGRTLTFWISGRVSPRNRPKVIGWSFIGLIGTLIWFALTRNLFWIHVILFVLGILLGFLYALSFFLSLSISQEKKGQNAGLVESVVGSGLILAPILGGLFMEYTGILVSPWIFSIFVVGAVGLGLGLWYWSSIRKAEGA